MVRACRSHDDDTLIIELQYEIDHYSAGPLRVTLTAAAACGFRRLVFDTRSVTFADSALFTALESWQRHGRTVQIAQPSPAVTRLRQATAPSGGRQPICGSAMVSLPGRASGNTTQET
ncbi:STAS domain-containing protein [Streptomyces sp. NPDC049837]|uniref:STAS domain-containing protein n=1 Tax=Streptomyces sp. NPDC049837 TaxID=3155277 RepID=UPI0034480D02